jgi:hypothetical protein
VKKNDLDDRILSLIFRNRILKVSSTADQKRNLQTKILEHIHQEVIEEQRSQKMHFNKKTQKFEGAFSDLKKTEQ